MLNRPTKLSLVDGPIGPLLHSIALDLTIAPIPFIFRPILESDLPAAMGLPIRPAALILALVGVVHDSFARSQVGGEISVIDRSVFQDLNSVPMPLLVADLALVGASGFVIKVNLVDFDLFEVQHRESFFDVFWDKVVVFDCG